MIDVSAAASLEGSHVPIGKKAQRAPETGGPLNAKLILERAQRRVRAVMQVAPRAAGQPVPE